MPAPATAKAITGTMNSKKVNIVLKRAYSASTAASQIDGTIRSASAIIGSDHSPCRDGHWQNEQVK